LKDSRTIGLLAVSTSLICLVATAQPQGTTASAGAKFGPQWRLPVGEGKGEAAAGTVRGV
jgi:hypothetical protein